MRSLTTLRMQCVAALMLKPPADHFLLDWLAMLLKCFRNCLLWMLMRTSSQIRLQHMIRFITFQLAWTLPMLVSTQITSLMNSLSSRKNLWLGTLKPWLVLWIRALKYLITATAFAMKRARVAMTAHLNSLVSFRLIFVRCFVKVKDRFVGLRFRAIQKILRAPTKQSLIYFQTTITCVAGSPWRRTA